MLRSVFAPAGQSNRGSVLIMSRDTGSTDDGTWQSGRVRVAGGTDWRFVARGLPFLPVAAEADVRYHVEEIPAAKRNVYSADTEQLMLDECYSVRLPTSIGGIADFVAANLAGIGPQRAAEIARRMGGDAITRLNDQPAHLEAIFPGKVGRDLAYAWQHWRDHTWHAHEQAYDLSLRMASRGIKYAHARKIISFFRSADVAEIVLLRRPYRLLEMPGFAWKRADLIARHLGLAPDSSVRIGAAAAEALRAAQVDHGHSCMPARLLVDAAAPLTGSRVLAAAGLAAAVETGAIVDDHGWCYLPGALEAEWTVARHVRRRMGTHADISVHASTVASEIAAARLTLAQAGAVWDALTCGLFVLTGGPGTGKTTTARTIVRCAGAMGLRFRVVAPTGKAAARATKVTGAQAETIHRFVGGPPGSRRSAPIELDLVIVDEASMMSVEAAAWLLANLAPTCRVVVVGDPDQLPSVDHGAVLRDLLMAAGIPTVRLDEVHRQARESGIVRNAHRILQGEVLEARPDFHLLSVPGRATEGERRPTGAAPRRARDDARSVLVHELARLRAKGLDLTTDVQVLTPMKKKTHRLGVHALNLLLQDTLNPDGAVGPVIAAGRCAKVGDRVMQMRNDYALGECGVFNGEVGVVTAVGPDRVVVRFDGDRDLTIGGYRLAALQLAWAMTIHRSQGTEWPAVIVVAHSSHGAMLTRELLYTAVTRARTQATIIADDAAYAMARSAATLANVGRNTGLLRHLIV